MPQPLQLLIAEDNPADAELVIRALRRAGFEPTFKCVETEAAYLEHLNPGLDLVLSDYEMPQFSGLRALELLKQSRLEVPLIVVSGTIGEETAVAAMRLGAADYLLKDRLARLGPAVERAVGEARLQRERRLHEKDFRLLFAQNPMPMWVYEVATLRFLAVNDAAITHYGYTRQEFLAMTLREIRPPEEVPNLLKSIRDRPAGMTRPGIWRHRKKDGTEIMVETTAHRTTFQGISAELVLANDVTHRLAAEKELRLFRTLINQSNDTIEVIDPATGRFLDVNQKGPEELGCTRQEYLAQRVFDIDPKMSEEGWREFARSIKQTGTAKGEGSHRRWDGTVFPIEFNAKWVHLDRDYIVTVVRDITERKQAEEVVRQASGHLVRDRRKLAWIEGAILCVATAAVYGLAVRYDWFEAIARWFSVDEIAQMDEVVFTTLFFTVGLLVLAFRRWRESVSKLTGQQQMQAALELLHGELERRVKQRTAELDDTNRALRDSEERFRQMAESIDEVFWMSDIEKNRIIYISPAYEAVWGRKCEELYADPQSWVESIQPEDRIRVTQAVRDKLPTGEYDETYRILRPDGAVRWIRARAFPVKTTDGQVRRVAGVAEDITEQKKLEEQFLHAQRMEAIGTLAAGVAHDLNNILGPMLMVAGLLKLKYRDGADHNLLTLVETGAQRGAGVIRQLMLFSRGMSGERVIVQVRHLIRELAGLLRETFPRDITICESTPADLWPVLGDATQLHQVLMNLCVNARDAMPRGGRLIIGGENTELGLSDTRLHVGSAVGRHLIIRVEDTGDGIPPEVAKRMFDPFFTTKAVGKGTGLGLSTVVGIVKSHGGFISHYSEPGKGTRFMVYLPVADDEAREPSDRRVVDPARGRGELIIVVDDEAPIRGITCDVLKEYNYQVLPAKDGTEALGLFLDHQDRVRLILTDIMMPSMDGLALTRALRAIAPDLAIVATTGLDQEARKQELAAFGVTEILIKPCAPADLLAALRRSLDPVSSKR